MDRPLEGKRILVTRAKRQAGAFSEQIRNRGGIPIEIPLIAFRKPSNTADIDRVLEKIEAYDWVIFTSVNGVRFFIECLKTSGLSFPTKARVAVVGKKTLQALESQGIKVDLVPEDFVAESLVKRLRVRLKGGESVLLPRGNLARDILPRALREYGVDVTDLTVYATVRNEEGRQSLQDLLERKGFDVVTFTSSSTVHHFFELLNELDFERLLKGVKWACIGPITAETLNAYGYEADIMPDDYTTTSLLDHIEQYYRGDVS